MAPRKFTPSSETVTDGRALGLSERQAKYMLSNRELPGQKVGERMFFLERENAA